MDPCASTFSIVARCPRTGQLGIAVATAVPAVGGICPYVAPRVGAVSTQSWVNPYLALDILGLLKEGLSARDALDRTLRSDPAAAVRQLGVVDSAGGSAAHTGADCTPWCGDITAEGVSIQGNMLVDGRTVEAMAEAFARTVDAPLSERLMSALEAGDGAGGDKRGKQSAALTIYGEEDYAALDIRADEHPAPVKELRRILVIAQQQLVPFVAGMPRRGAPAAPAPDHVTTMLLRSPPERPGGGGSGPTPTEGA